MHLNDWIAVMERIAPPELACDFDNPGLLISPESTEVRRVLVALDCTMAVAREAIERKADLVLTHHPLFFTGVKHLRNDDPETAAALLLIRHGIGLYAAHTNLDAAAGGVNDVLMAAAGVSDVRPLPPENLGRIGTLKLPQKTLAAFAEDVERGLNCPVQAGGDPNRIVRTVACVSGSGGSELWAAAEAGADVFLTGELKHNQVLDANALGLALIVAGHHETECPVLPALIDRLQHETNDVQYNLALSDGHPLWRP